MTESVSARALLADVMEGLPPPPEPELGKPLDGDPVEDHALAALAALTEPSVVSAALAELATLEQIAAAKPHLVRVKDGVVVTPDLDEKGKHIKLGGVLQYTRSNTVTSCPDCRRGVYSLDGVLACVQVHPSVGPLDGKPGDVVACGRER